jgi:ribosomal protein L44E
MRLGDDIDEYCSRCKRTTNHSVLSLVGEEVKKVRCRTCNYEHNYRKNRAGKKEMSAQEAFDKVLASVMGQQPATPGPAPIPKKGRKS